MKRVFFHAGRNSTVALKPYENTFLDKLHPGYFLNSVDKMLVLKNSNLNVNHI